MMAAMTEAGEGERRLAERKRRKRAIFEFLFILAVGGGVNLAVIGSDDGILQGPISIGYATVLSAMWLTMIIGGAIRWRRVADERDLGGSGRSLAWGGSAVVIAYPVWWLFWRAGFVGEPSAHMLFLALCGIAALAYLIYRFR